MDLAELSRRTKKGRRELRYVLDHDLIPDFHIKIIDDEVGRPRHFHEDVGFAIVCAIELRDLGLPHATIRRFFRQLIEYKLLGKPALVQILSKDCPAFADLGDGERVRLRVEGTSPIVGAWSPVQKGPYSPKITVTLDVGQIRDQIFHGA